MANYTFVGPDDIKYQFTGPAGLNEYDIGLIKNNFFKTPSQLPTTAPVEPKGETGFIPSIMRGGRGIASLLTDVAPAMAAHAFGYDDYARKQMEEAAAYQRETERLYPAEVASYKDIDTVGKALTYIKESIGEALPSILPSVLTGGAAAAFSRPAIVAAEKAAQSFAEKQIAEAAAKGVLTDTAIEGIRKAALDTGAKEAQKIVLKYEAAGALAGSALQNIPDVYQNIYEATGKQDLGAALAFGGFNAALDAITPISLLRKMHKSGISPEEVGAAWYKRAGRGLLQGFVTEGGTEALQEVSSAAAEKFVDQNQQFFTEKNFERFINAGLKGGFGGAGITAATDVAFGKGPQREEPPEIEGQEPTPPITPPVTPPVTPAVPLATAAPSKQAFKIHPKGVQNVGQPIPPPSGEGAEVPSATGTDTSTGGLGGVKPPRVVRPGEDVTGAAVGEATQPPTLEKPLLANFRGPNPRAPDDTSSWQDKSGSIHYNVDVPLPNGRSRVLELIDQEQAQNIALRFEDSKGNKNRVLSVGMGGNGVPYWYMGDVSQEVIRQNIGDDLYNSLGNAPITNTQEYEALFNRVKNALTALKKPAALKTEDFQEYVEDGINTEYSDVGTSLFKYTQNGDLAGISEAVKSPEYPAYIQVLHKVLKDMYPSGLIPVRHIAEYAGYKDTGEGPMSVSINPDWGRGAKAAGKEVQSFEVPIEDVIAAGNGAEGELIIKRQKPATAAKPKVETEQEKKLRQEIEAQEAAEGEPRKPYGERYTPPAVKTQEEIEAEQKAAFEEKAAQEKRPTEKELRKQTTLDEIGRAHV